jgi:hypothetical protein
MSNGDQRIVEPVPISTVVMHITGRHDMQPHSIGDVTQGLRERPVTAHGVPLEFDKEAIAPEYGRTPVRNAACRRDTLLMKDLWQETGAATGKYDQPLVTFFERRHIETWVSSIFALEVSLGGQATQVGVSLLILRQDRYVAAVEQGDFGARDGLDAEVGGGLSKRHRSVHTVVVGERERRVSQALGFEHELLGQRRAVEKRERGMAVEFDVHRE